MASNCCRRIETKNDTPSQKKLKEEELEHENINYKRKKSSFKQHKEKPRKKIN